MSEKLLRSAAMHFLLNQQASFKIFQIFIVPSKYLPVNFEKQIKKWHSVKIVLKKFT